MNVVVAVNEHGRATGAPSPLSPHDGVTPTFDADAVEADSTQLRGEPVRAASQFALPAGIGADGREADEFL